jgi:carboxymethylenebutenolidase
MAMFETIAAEGGPMRVFADAPKSGGKRPALVVAHHRGGLDSFTQKFVMDLAAEGYVAAAPHLFHRRPAGEDTLESIKHLDDGEIVVDVKATVAHLAGLANVDADRIGIAGHCMGGRVSFLGASSVATMKACVVYYGGGMMQTRGRSDTAPIHLLRNMPCPVAGFFGNDDKNPSPDDVARIGAELDRHGKTRAFHSYDGCGHAFQNFLNLENYRPKAARDSWDKMVAWLAKSL